MVQGYLLITLMEKTRILAKALSLWSWQGPRELQVSLQSRPTDVHVGRRWAYRVPSGLSDSAVGVSDLRGKGGPVQGGPARCPEAPATEPMNWNQHVGKEFSHLFYSSFFSVWRAPLYFNASR